MRLFIALAIIFTSVSLVCTLVPTEALTVGWAGWLTAGFLAFLVDQVTGGYVINAHGRAQ